jgi:hypothetical protein
LKKVSDGNTDDVSSGKHKKYFVIKYGPPSSGKGYLEGLLAKQLDINDYIDVNVDKYVEYAFNNKELRKTCVHTVNTDTISQDVYFCLRKQFASNMSDDIMYMALRKNKHVMWETTGNTVDWTINYVIPLVKKFKYTVVLMYPIVNLKSLVERCNKRAQAANCTEEYLGTIKRNADNNFGLIQKHVDLIYIYDNNNKKPITAFSTEDARSCKKLPTLERNVILPKNLFTQSVVNLPNRHISCH